MYTCAFVTRRCKMHSSVAARMLHRTRVGEKARARNLVFPCEVDAAGDDEQLVCAAVAGPIVTMGNRFLLCVLQ